MVARLGRYLLVGGVNTLAGMALIFGLMHGAGLGPVAANVIGFAICIVGSYFMNRSFTFRHRGHAGQTLPRFVAVQGAAYLANLATLLLLHDTLSVDRNLAQLGAVAVYTAIGFAGSNFLVFRRAGEIDGN